MFFFLRWERTVSRYSHKIMELVRHVLAAAMSLEMTEHRFKVQKEALTRTYLNKKFEQPYQTALYTSSILHEVNRWHMSEYEAVIGNLSLADLQVGSRTQLDA